MKSALFFIFTIFISYAQASDLSECGDYFLVGEVIQDKKESETVQFLVNKTSMSAFKLDVKKVEAVISLLALEGQSIKIKAKIEKPAFNYTGEIAAVEDIQVLLPPQYKMINSIELTAKKECQK